MAEECLCGNAEMIEAEKLTKSLDIELFRSEGLKEDIRKDWKLPENNLVIKRNVRNSPGIPSYEPIGVDESNFLKRVDYLASRIDVKRLCGEIRDEVIQ